MKPHISLFTLFDLETHPNDAQDGITEIEAITITLSGSSRPELSPLGSTLRGDAPNRTSVGLPCPDAISFTVQASAIELDAMSIRSFQTKSHDDDDADSIAYLLHVKEVSGLKFIRIYNHLREKVLQVTGVDASYLRKGFYFFKALQFSIAQPLKTSVKQVI